MTKTKDGELLHSFLVSEIVKAQSNKRKFSVVITDETGKLIPKISYVTKFNEKDEVEIILRLP
jgi:hypothetical protein